jgi:aminoacyl-tRNA hydrolase
MALFQKRPQVSNPVQFTTVGLNKTLLIVGLGNPGEEYADTRHNIGFICVDAFAAKNGFDAWTNKKDLKCMLTQQTMGDTRVILVKPQTFMNLSGEAVQAVQHFYKLNNTQLVVVHDELDVNFGQLRMRVGGSAAGNNGIKSVTQHVGQDFSKKEQEQLPALVREVCALLSEYAYGTPFAAETRSFL